jgi:hypothetical protein
MPVFRVQGTVAGQPINRAIIGASPDDVVNKILRVVMPPAARQTIALQAAWATANVNVTVEQILGLPVVGPTDFDN